jgi:tetratricopeptide (TPR) repeat protein
LLWVFRKRLGRGPIAAVAFFAVTLTPALGFFDVYPFRFSFVADHFQYHASMGLIVLGAAVLTRAVGVGGRVWMSRAVVVLPVVLGLLSYRQAHLYTDIETLWRRTIAANPGSWLARYNLALRLARDEDQPAEAVETARQYLQEVTEIYPAYVNAYASLGLIAARQGRQAEALAYYREALSIDPADPRAHYNMARALERTGEIDGALAAYQACLAANPYFAPAHHSLARLALERGDRDQAVERFRRAFEVDRRYAPALRDLGKVYEQDGRLTEAATYYRRALAIDPSMAEGWFRLGVCLRKSGDAAEAREAYRRAIEVDPSHAEAYADMAAMAYETGDFGAAAALYERALGLSPGDTRCRLNLVTVYGRLGRHADGLGVLEAGLQDRPGSLPLMHRLARELASAPGDAAGDPLRAIRLAEHVVDHLDPPRPEVLQTLALAYAAAGAYAEAADAAERGRVVALDVDMGSLAAELEAESRAYRARAGSAADAP